MTRLQKVYEAIDALNAEFKQLYDEGFKVELEVSDLDMRTWGDGQHTPNLISLSLQIYKLQLREV